MVLDGSIPEQQIVQTLEAIGDLFGARDVEGVLDLFSPGEDVLLVGSESGEVARGREGIRRSLEELFERPEAYSFVWKSPDVSVAGELAWVFAEGSVLILGDDGATDRLPYRMSGVLELVAGRWLWRMLVGSEPVPAQ